MRRLSLIALLSGIAVSFVACPKPKPQPVKRPVAGPRSAVFVAPLLTESREVFVDALWVRKKRVEIKKKMGAKKSRLGRKRYKIEYSGGMTKVALHVMPNVRRVTTVGVAEQYPGGAGQTWKASVWIASRKAAQTVGRELIDYAFFAKSTDFIDGPSAGALFTAGFMAAIMGDTVNPQATMTGTVNPDGTVGMVGGLEYKFRAAIKAGKKLLGYPEGNKRFKNRKGLVVDLEDLATESGAKAVPIRDIYQAYKLLTGNEFAHRKGVSPKEMVMGKAIHPVLQAMTKRWLDMHESYVTRARSRMKSPWLKAIYKKRLATALGYKGVADEAVQKKLMGAAYYNAVRSATWAYTAASFTEVVSIWRRWNKNILSQYWVKRRWQKKQWAARRAKHQLGKERGGPIMGLDLHTQSKTVAVVYNNGELRIFSTQTGKLKKTIKASKRQLWTVAFGPKGRKVAVGGSDHNIRIYDARTGWLLKTLKGHSKLVISLAFGPRGRKIVSGSSDDTAKVWDARTGRVLQTITAHKRDINAVAISPNGKLFATGGDEGIIKIFDLATYKEKKTLSGHSSWIWGLSFGPKSKYLVSAGRDNTARVWDVKGGKELKKVATSDDCIDVHVGPRGKNFVVGTDDAKVLVVELKTGKILRTLKGHKRRVMGVRIGAKGLTIASGAKGGTAKLWELATGTLTRDIVGKTAKEYKCDAVNWVTGACKKYKQELADIENPKQLKPPSPPADFKKKLFEVAADMEKRLKQVKKAQKQLEKHSKPTTVDEALALISGYEELIHGVAFARIGQYRFGLIKRYKKFWKRMQRYSSVRSRLSRRFRRHKRSSGSSGQQRFAKKVVNYVEAAVRYAGIAFGKSSLALDHARLFEPGTAKLNLTDERMRSLTKQLFAAAKANLDYLETMIPTGFRGVFIRRHLNVNVPTYVIARLGFNRSGKLVLNAMRERELANKTVDFGKGYAALGAAVAAYIASAKLRFKVTSGQNIKSGVTTPRLKRMIVLTTALSRGRQFALEAAYKSKTLVGTIPTVSRMLFQAAEKLRKASLGGQIKAVELYWRAALYCNLAMMLVRKTPAPKAAK
jgi:WD40 repeat protein